jgi:hypothetical protein
VLVSSTPTFAEVASIPYALNVGALFLMQAGLARLVTVEDRDPKNKNKLNPQLVARFRLFFWLKPLWELPS